MEFKQTESPTMTLLPFVENDYDTLIQWIDSSELNYLWGGPMYQFPLTVKQISEHCSKPEVKPYIAVINGKKAGYIELYQVSRGHFRICRVFIADEYRGQGLSKVMLSTLISKAVNEFGCSKLSLAVFAHNASAISCYDSLGFKQISVEKGTRSFNGHSWDLLRMEKLISPL